METTVAHKEPVRAAVIMAGGRGERFWPKSRRTLPKQFLRLAGERTMIQMTVDRLRPLFPPERIFIVTNVLYRDLCLEQLPDIPQENLIFEPAARNTAPCIGLAATLIRGRFGDTTLAVLPSDHTVLNVELFRLYLMQAMHKAERGANLVTLGITPDHPDVSYGYIRFSTQDYSVDDGLMAMPVEEFVEKPDLETARRYLNEGTYLWNSGMFAFTCETILAQIEQLLPDLYQGLLRIEAAQGTAAEDAVLAETYASMQSISIDYGVLEHAERLFTIPSSFGWDDVGSWQALERIRPGDLAGNLVEGLVIVEDTRNCLLEASEGRLLAAVGLEDLVVVDTPDALLVCRKDRMPDIRKILDRIREMNLTSHL